MKRSKYQGPMLNIGWWFYFSAAFYPDGILGRAHGDGRHSYPNNNHLQVYRRRGIRKIKEIHWEVLLGGRRVIAIISLDNAFDVPPLVCLVILPKRLWNLSIKLGRYLLEEKGFWLVRKILDVQLVTTALSIDIAIFYRSTLILRLLLSNRFRGKEKSYITSFALVIRLVVTEGSEQINW